MAQIKVSDDVKAEISALINDVDVDTSSVNVNTHPIHTQKPMNADPLPMKYYKHPYNYHRRARLIMFSSFLKQHANFIALSVESRFDIVEKIEKSCLQYCFDKTNEFNIPPKWSSDIFTDLYTSVCAKIGSNIDQYNSVKNPYLTNQILEGKVDIDKLPRMTSQELYPEKYKEVITKLEESKNVKKTIKASVMYRCRICKQNKCTVENRYNRSLDEGVNLTITCMNCGHQWNG